MRNHILALILILFVGREINAQPTLAAYNSNPVSSVKYTCIGVDYIAPSNPSGFTTWDFSSLVPKDTFITRYYGHGEVQGDSLFPLSDISQKTRNTYEFFITYTQGVSLSGYQDSLTYVYSDYADLIRYPFTYPNQYTDNFSCKYILKSDTINRSGSITVSAPAYGNIKLPYANINNVLGVKIIESFSDITKTGTESHEIITYSWRVPGVSTPILSFRSENFNGNFKESGFYLTKESLGVKDNKSVAFDVSLINLSANKIPALNIEAPNSLTVRISCVNSTGKEMFAPVSRRIQKGQNKVVLPDQNILPGIYLLIISSDDYQIIKRCIVTQ